MASLNFSQIPSREPLEEGVYLMTIEDVTEKIASTGKNMLLIRYKEPETGVAVFDNCVLTPGALWKLKEICDAIGIDTSVDMDTADLIPMMVGAEVKVKVIQEDYEGHITNRAKKVYAC